MKYYKQLRLSLLSILTVIFLNSCGSDIDCKVCSFDGETMEVCEEDIIDFNNETGLNVSSLDELTTIINQIGGSCE